MAEKAPVNGGEAILRDGRALGVTSSADFGHTVGCPIVYGYVPAEDAGFDDYEVEVYGTGDQGQFVTTGRYTIRTACGSGHRDTVHG